MERRNVLCAVVAIESVSFLLAILLGVLSRVHWWNDITPSPTALTGLVLGMLTPVASLGALAWLRRHGRGRAGAYVDNLLVPAIRHLRPIDVVFVAAASGLCEEALFRGAMQPLMGILATSLVFGLLHTGSRELVSMGVWAVLMSLLLGLLYSSSGTLLAPILGHATHNLVTMLYLRGPYRANP